MRLRLTIKTFAFILIVVCCTNQNKYQYLDNKIIVDSNLSKSKHELLEFHSSKDEIKKTWNFDNNEGLCRLVNDTIVINNIRGFMTSKSITIFIHNDNFTFDAKEQGCVHDYFYKPIYQKLILNKKKFELNDTIIGEIQLKAIAKLNNSGSKNDTIVISGKFKHRIREAEFDRNKLNEENNFEKFISLTKNNTDTVTTITLYDSGIKKIPEEILLFKNLEALNLRMNDLNNIDLSIILNLKKLKSLNLEYCNLNEIPDVVFRNNSLIKLNISNNKIKFLPNKLFKMSTLTELYMDGNYYLEIPKEISNLKNLEILSVESSWIKTFPNSMLKLKKLKVIYPPSDMDTIQPQLNKLIDFRH